MSTVITGASGQLGRLVTAAVRRRDPDADLVLVTRDPAAYGDVPAGAELRAGDFNDPASLPAAFAGGERLLLISTNAIGARIAQHHAAIDAAAAAGVRSVAYTSLVNPSDSNPVALADEHRETEDHLRASGLAWTFLRNAIYTEMLVDAAKAAVASGSYVSNEGDGASAHVSRADCAEAAAAVLTSEGHEGKAYDVTGAEALTATQRAALFAELSGRPVAATLVDDDAFAAGLVAHAGLPEAAARLYASFGESARRGYAAPVSTAVADLTGHAPHSIRSVLAPHLAA